MQSTGVTPGTYSFNVNALVDGAIVATESDRIVVISGEEGPQMTRDGHDIVLIRDASFRIIRYAPAPAGDPFRSWGNTPELNSGSAFCVSAQPGSRMDCPRRVWRMA